MSEQGPAWGIEPVPERLRVLGLVDQLLLWGNLSVSLLVIVAGALVVPALSLSYALLAIVVASVSGCALLGLAAAIGADGRVPSMVLLRSPLGRKGSWLPTGLNVIQCLGWGIFELLIIATAASALSDQLFGWRGKPVWTVAFGAVALALAFLGPVGVLVGAARAGGVVAEHLAVQVERGDQIELGEVRQVDADELAAAHLDRVLRIEEGGPVSVSVS